MTPVNDALPLNPGDAAGYRVRRSSRARSVRLQISAREGLTVVIPRGFDARRVPAIVERRRDWIETHLRRLAVMAAEPAPPPALAPPARLELPALGESWRIEYHPTRTRRTGVLVDPPGCLTVYGAVGDPEACRGALRQWLRLRTRQELVPWLTRLAAENGFQFGEVRIRGPRTRWASCSSAKTITLSYKLLFLDRDAVRCILLHELCHTVFMNHSSRFWQLLGRFEPAYKVIHKRMRGGWKEVPAWAEARTGREGSTDIG